MKAKIKNGKLRLMSECDDDSNWIREASRHNFLQNLGASVGAPPNWLELDSASGFHAYELTGLLKEVSKKLEGIGQAFVPKDGEK